MPPVSGAIRAVWNPSKRQRKLLTDAGPMVIRLILQNPNSEYTLVSTPYLILLNYVMNRPGSPWVTARQFLVVQTTHEGTGEGEFQPLFASRWHAYQAEPEIKRQAAYVPVRPETTVLPGAL